MTRSFSSALAICVFATLIQTARSGPACSKQYQNKAECMQFCRSRWGFNTKDLTVDQTGGGLFLGVDPWGVVIAQSGLSLDEWILAACTGQKPSESGKKKSKSSSAASSSTSSSSSIAPSSNSTSASSSSSSSSSPPPSSSPKKEEKPTSQPPPPPPPQTSSPPPSPPPSPTKEDPKPSPPPPPSPSPTQGNNNGGNTGGGGGGGGGETGDDQQAWLDAHNSLRAKKGAGPLTWSNEAAAKAQQWANGCKFEHSGGSLGPFGENLAAGTGDDYNVQSAFKSWADEEKDFNPGSPNPSHYTQVVWKGSTQVGCALQMCDGIFASSFGKSKYYVCEYSPQGNIIGKFGDNVQ